MPSLTQSVLNHKAVIDIATLTGACVIALGCHVRTGMFATEDGHWPRTLQKAGNDAMDLCWRMPLDDEYADVIEKSNFADVGQCGWACRGRHHCGQIPCTALRTKYPWAHLDIAGTAWKGGAAKGATGRPVGLLLQYLIGQQAATQPKSPAKSTKPVKPAKK